MDARRPEIVFVAEPDDDGGFTAFAIGESIFTEADMLEELSDQARNAVECHFDEWERPGTIRILTR